MHLVENVSKIIMYLADHNLQRDLGAIGPYEFQVKPVWSNLLAPCLQRKSVWTNGPERSSQVVPETGIGPWMFVHNVNGYSTGAENREIVLQKMFVKSPTLKTLTSLKKEVRPFLLSDNSI